MSARKQDWTTRPRILGWVVVNMNHRDITGEEEAPAAVVAAESGYVWTRRIDAMESARELREEHQNDGIVAVPVLYPGQIRESRGR